MSRLVNVKEREVAGTNDTLEAAVHRCFSDLDESLRKSWLVESCPDTLHVMMANFHHLLLDTRRLLNEGRVYDVVDNCLDDRLNFHRKLLDDCVQILEELNTVSAEVDEKIRALDVKLDEINARERLNKSVA